MPKEKQSAPGADGTPLHPLADRFARAHSVSIQLEHRFDDSERLNLGKALSNKLRDIDGINEHKKEIMAQINAQLAEAKAGVSSISAKLQSGFEVRPKDVLLLYGDPDRHTKSYYDPETKELLKSEPMLASDFEQLPMDYPKQPAAAPPPEPAEDLNIPGTAEDLPADNPAVGKTPLAAALDEAAKGKDVPPVPMALDESYPAERMIGLFRKAAKKIKWPEACIDLIDEACKKIINDSDTPAEAAEGVRMLLQAHTVS